MFAFHCGKLYDSLPDDAQPVGGGLVTGRVHVGPRVVVKRCNRAPVAGCKHNS